MLSMPIYKSTSFFGKSEMIEKLQPLRRGDFEVHNERAKESQKA
jgi:hypothetical protein